MGKTQRESKKEKIYDILISMRRVALCMLLAVFSVPLFAVQTVNEIWEEFSQPGVEIQSDDAYFENFDERADYLAKLDGMIASLETLLADASYLYVRDQNPDLYSLTGTIRDVAKRYRAEIADESLTGDRLSHRIAESQQTIEHFVCLSLLNERKIARDAGNLYAVLVVLLSALGALLLLSLFLYSGRKKRVAELEQAMTSERLITNTIMQAQENERARIYRDLHDTVAQDIKASNLFVSQLALLPNQTADAKDLFAKLELLGNRMTNEIYAAIKNLTPPELHERFINSIEDLCKNTTSLAGIPCKYFIMPEIREKLSSLDEHKKLHIYRIIQESLNNAIKHASPTECSLLITGKDGCIDIFVTNDGTGFDNLSEMLAKDTFGLKGMMSRAESIGATLNIDSSTEAGTEIKLHIPIQNTVIRGGVSLDGTE